MLNKELALRAIDEVARDLPEDDDIFSYFLCNELSYLLTFRYYDKKFSEADIEDTLDWLHARINDMLIYYRGYTLSVCAKSFMAGYRKPYPRRHDTAGNAAFPHHYDSLDAYDVMRMVQYRRDMLNQLRHMLRAI